MNLLLFLAGLAALVVGANLLVRGASRLALSLGISPLVVGLTVVAFGTSAPEVAVSVGAVLDGPQPYDKALWKGLGELGYLRIVPWAGHGAIGKARLTIAQGIGRRQEAFHFSTAAPLLDARYLERRRAEQAGRRMQGFEITTDGHGL